MANFDLGGTGVVESWLEALITDHQATAGEEGHDGTLADTSITDY